MTDGPSARGTGRLWPGASIRAWLQGLAARFDAVALRPFEWPHDGLPGPEWPALQDWCRVRPAPRLAVAQAEAGSTAAAAAAVRAAAAVALRLDGSEQLQAARGAPGRLALRLRVKLQDALGGWGGADGLDGIWDSGWVPADPKAWLALSTFTPRRATLIVMYGLPAAEVQPLLAALQARSGGFRRPLRVLLVDDGSASFTGLGTATAPRVLALPD